MATVHVGANADPHTEHHAGLLHRKVGSFRLKAVGPPRRPHVLTHRAGRLRVAAIPIRDRTTASGCVNVDTGRPRPRSHHDLEHPSSRCRSASIAIAAEPAFP